MSVLFFYWIEKFKPYTSMYMYTFFNFEFYVVLFNGIKFHTKLYTIVNRKNHLSIAMGV